MELVYTGVGKVNAAFSAAKAILSASVKSLQVINYGSAGTNTHPLHSLLTCTRFQQADMDARPLVPAAGITPFDELLYPQVEKGILEFSPNGQLCTTQDSFQTNPQFEVNDMEAYAIAKVCRILGVPFTAYKFISDSGDAGDWEKNHHLGMEQFRNLLTEWYA